jgi:hypothetical protein
VLIPNCTDHGAATLIPNKCSISIVGVSVQIEVKININSSDYGILPNIIKIAVPVNIYNHRCGGLLEYIADISFLPRAVSIIVKIAAHIDIHQ